jgi:hypothetical protein
MKKKEEKSYGVLTEGGTQPQTAGDGPMTVTELDGRAIRARMDCVDASNGSVVWRRCSRVPFIGLGW